MRRERVPERVADDPLGDARALDGFMHCSLHDRLVKMVAEFAARLFIAPSPARREHPLPSPLRRGALELSLQRRWHPYLSESGCQILLMPRSDLHHVLVEQAAGLAWQHRPPVALSLRISHHNLVSREIEILHTQRQCLEQTQPRAIQQ